MKKAKNKTTKKTVKAVCVSCGGTGLYEGMFENKGEPVICLNCDGTGCQEIEYEPFVTRKKMRGVKAVHFSRGAFIATGVGKTGEPMTYEEFLSDKWRKL
jgi:DnaJ-class molecular chaperone